MFAPNILKVADIPQLAALVAPRRLAFIEPVGYGRQVMGPDEAEEALRFARDTYDALGSGEALEIE